MWTDNTLKLSQERVSRLRSALSKIECAPTDEIIRVLARNIADDLNTPAALAVLDKWASTTLDGATGGSVGELSRFIDGALGLAL
jgi:L-cysteine:1D-myo-inositol 2-amino-2-deoxy-alpha-D-glucopyranoside ligase